MCGVKRGRNFRGEKTSNFCLRQLYGNTNECFTPEGLANYGSQPVFVNKVLLEHSHDQFLCIIYDFFCATRKLSSYVRDHMARRAKYIFTNWPLTEKVS